MRDWLLVGRVAHDWDLIVDGGGRPFAERLARRLDGRLVEPAGTRFAICRVVTDEHRIDIWDRQGTPLDDELERRDFTINSIAVELADGTVHDPLGGLEDLTSRRLRANRSDSFEDDPLRILRLLRFELVLERFRATDDTLEAARRSAPALAGVAAERIREELDRVLAGRPAPGLGRRLVELDLHPRLWTSRSVSVGRPEAARSEESRARDRARDDSAPWRGAISLAELDRCLDRAEAAAGREIEPYERVALRHAALTWLAQQDAPESCSAAHLLTRGWVSRRVARRIEALLEPRDRPTNEDQERLFLNRAGSAWPAVAGFDLWRAQESERAAWRELLDRLGALAAREGEVIFEPAPLLRGDEIARRLGIEPGPELGRVVERLRRLQITGRIRTPEAACEWLAGRSEDLPPPRG